MSFECGADCLSSAPTFSTLRISARQACFFPDPGIIKIHNLVICVIDGKTGVDSTGLILILIFDANASARNDNVGHLHVGGITRMVALVERSPKGQSDIVLRHGPPKAEDSSQQDNKDRCAFHSLVECIHK